MELSPEIILDDIEVLREELEMVQAELDRRVDEARKQGIEV